MRFASLGSGSRGNATLVEQGHTCLLIDCGYSMKQVLQRLARLGKGIDDITAILVTHEHSDHIAGVEALSRKYGIPVWMTHGTWVQGRVEEVAELHTFSSHEAFEIGDLAVQPFPVPHDAREPAQFVFGDGRCRLGMVTDLGTSTPHVEAQLSGCDALLLECNHEVDMLACGSYPPSVKRRVGGDHGHLNNHQAAELLAAIDTSRLQHIVAAHLSEKHNRPELARAALCQVLGCTSDWIGVIDQDEGLAWREVA